MAGRAGLGGPAIAREHEKIGDGIVVPGDDAMPADVERPELEPAMADSPADRRPRPLRQDEERDGLVPLPIEHPGGGIGRELHGRGAGEPELGRPHADLSRERHLFAEPPVHGRQIGRGEAEGRVSVLGRRVRGDGRLHLRGQPCAPEGPHADEERERRSDAERERPDRRPPTRAELPEEPAARTLRQAPPRVDGAERPAEVALAIDGRATGGTTPEVRLDLERRFDAELVVHVGGEPIAEVAAAHRACLRGPVPRRSPRSVACFASAARRRARPRARRDITVPSGQSTMSAISR